MKKFIKVFVLLTTMMFSFMLTSCFNGGSSNLSNKTRRAKLEEVKELITEFHLYENFDTNINIYDGDTKVGYSNFKFDSFEEDGVWYIKIIEEKYTLNEDPYGELYKKEIITKNEVYTKDFGRPAFASLLDESLFVNNVYSVYVNNGSARLHGYINQDSYKSILQIDDLTGIEKLSLDLTCENGLLEGYSLTYYQFGKKVVVSFVYYY